MVTFILTYPVNILFKFELGEYHIPTYITVTITYYIQLHPIRHLHGQAMGVYIVRIWEIIHMVNCIVPAYDSDRANKGYVMLTWLEIGLTSSATLFSTMYCNTTGFFATANPWPMRVFFSNMASIRLPFASSPFQSENTYLCPLNQSLVFLETHSFGGMMVVWHYTIMYIDSLTIWGVNDHIMIVTVSLSHGMRCHPPWREKWTGGAGWNPQPPKLMMTSSNGNIFRVTGPLCGQFTGLRWIPRTKASDAELWCFLWSAPE